MTSLPLSLSPMTSHPHRCCCCYPLRDTMLQWEHPLSGSRRSGTEYDCMPRCHILSCTFVVQQSACSISSSDAGSPRVFRPCYLVPRCPLPRYCPSPRFQRPRCTNHWYFLIFTANRRSCWFTITKHKQLPVYTMHILTPSFFITRETIRKLYIIYSEMLVLYVLSTNRSS